MRSSEENQKIREQLAEKRAAQRKIEDRSLIMVHTGDGKGKTSAALGVCIRSLVHGYKVAIVQYIKKQGDFKYAEEKLLDHFDNLKLFTLGAGFTWNTDNSETDRKAAEEAWLKTVEVVQSSRFDLIILDEINYAIDYGMLEVDKVVTLLEQKPKKLHLILTGRNAHPKIVSLANMVTEMKNIKHHYETSNILAQKGIEW